MSWIVKSYFSWKQQFEVKNIVMVDLFTTNTRLFALQDINLLWITCGLSGCLDSHSDGTHSLHMLHW